MGNSSFIWVTQPTYSPRGERHDPSGALKSLTFRRIWTSFTIFVPLIDEGDIDSWNCLMPNSAITCLAIDELIPLKSLVRNFRIWFIKKLLHTYIVHLYWGTILKHKLKNNKNIFSIIFGMFVTLVSVWEVRYKKALNNRAFVKINAPTLPRLFWIL